MASMASLPNAGATPCARPAIVYVDESWLARVPPMGDEEDALLDGAAAERLPNSRLSCQIKLAPELDGLVLRLPERQNLNTKAHRQRLR